MPLLSVLLPVRNGAATIRTAVTTTLRAMPRDSELVVLDDCSTDGTLAELDGFDDRRLRVILAAEPSGVAGGLNRLMADTDSALVGRMDADDACLPWRFSRQLPVLLGARADTVFTTVVNWYSHSRRIRPNAPAAISPHAFPIHLALTNPVSHPTMLATRRAIVGAGGYRSVPAEDYELWMRMHLTGYRLQRLRLPGLAYRLHPGQVTATDGWSELSWANPVVASSYGDLTEIVLGARFPRLNVMATSAELDEKAFDDLIGQFSRAVRGASSRLGSERPLVLRVLARRLGEVRALRARTVTSLRG